ncbi:MAG: hypothetical protein JNG90_08050 [Planctomycetaceae bacterium]|nr:hypothetical protein [Planctomycetaceae bacterium]
MVNAIANGVSSSEVRPAAHTARAPVVTPAGPPPEALPAPNVPVQVTLENLPFDPTSIAPVGAEVREVTLVNILASVAGQNPEVGFASQRYAEAYARLVAARVLWLPAINAGIGWNNHAGPLQASDGVVNQVSRSSLTAGLGVQTIGAGSPVVPGLFANFHSALAIFQPRIANRAAAARDAALRATINDLLMDTAIAYVDLYQLALQDPRASVKAHLRYLALMHDFSRPLHIDEYEAEIYAHAALRRYRIPVPRQESIRSREYVARCIDSELRRGVQELDHEIVRWCGRHLSRSAARAIRSGRIQLCDLRRKFKRRRTIRVAS